MTTRALTYALTRPKVLIPALFGLGLLVGKVSMFFGLGFLAFAALSASRLLSNTQLDDMLRLRDDKRRHKIGRLLNDPERQEILAIDLYAQRLRRSGADPGIAHDTIDKAWEIVRDAGASDSSGALHAYRHSLPPLEGGGDNKPAMANTIQRELDILHATQKEMESIDLGEPEILVEHSTA